MQMSDFKSYELNVYSQDGYKLRAVSEQLLGGPAFKLQYGIPNGEGVQGSWPVYAPNLAVDIGNAPESVGTAIYQLRQSVASEIQRASSAEASNLVTATQNHEADLSAITAEIARATFFDNKMSTDLATEVLSRQGDVFTLTNSVASEGSSRSAGDSALSSALSVLNATVNSNKTSSDSAFVEARVRDDSETAQRMAADASETQARVASFSELDAKILVAGSSISTEQFRAMASEQMLQSQISSLLVNTDPVALNSLAELVTDYKTNGLSLQARILYLESVVSTLCRKQLV